VPFKPGKSGNPAGRPKGAENKATREFKEWAEQFFTSQQWRASAQKRMLQGKAPHLESYALALLCGRPKESHEHSGEGGGPIQVTFGGRYRSTGGDEPATD
jgi:hypothetical protein